MLPTLLVGAVATGTLMFGAAVPVHAEPTTAAQASAELERLHDEAGELEEAYAQAGIKLRKGEERLDALKADIKAQQKRVDELADQARRVALTQFRSRGVDETTAIFVSGDPDTFMRTLSTTQKVEDNMNTTVQIYQTEQANLDDLQRAAQAEVETWEATKAKAEDLLAQGRQREQAMSRTLNRLTAEERAALEAEQDQGVVASTAATAKKVAASAPAPAVSGGSADARAVKAVQYAISKVGRSQYVWGAEGPNSFDCSGLMVAAYRSAGVSLPHSSAAQSRIGTPVSRANLRAGDLIFWYSPVSHVGIYIGDGKIVHARNTRVDIVMQTLNSYPAPYHSARRVLS
ncbi:MAG: NlpC/P60 family protein [Propioniciclava sp.]